MRKAYEKYVSFDDVWITSIPITWQSHKMKRLFCERSEKGYPHEQLLVASQNMGVVPKTIYGSRTVEAQKDLQLLKLVKIGDFVISLRSFEGGIEYAYYQGIISPAYTVLTTKGNIQRGYFRYLAKSKPFVKLLSLCVTGIREGQNIDYGKLINHLLPVPPREEQEQIVHFLDWKVSSINKLINLKQQEITELKELKKTTISDAVTHGLDKTVPMKDSGITWLGNIPKHWTTETLKRVSTLRKQKSYYNKNKDIFIGLENLKGYSDTLQETSTQYESSIQCMCKKGDLLFGKLRPYLSKVIICPKDCFCTNELLVVSFFNGNIKFLMYVFLHESFIDSVNASTYGAKMPRANDQYILNMSIPIPPREEQEQIVRFLDARCAEIDRLITENQAQITNLHDLKSSLIADVVTGQIDVRDVEIPDYEQVEESLYEADDSTLNSEDEIPEEV